jgi:hypothetical protein
MKGLDCLASKTWWNAAGTRALKTLAQTAVGIIGGTTLLGGVDWLVVLSGSAIAGVVSLLTSLAGIPEVTDPSDIKGGTD